MTYGAAMKISKMAAWSGRSKGLKDSRTQGFQRLVMYNSSWSQLDIVVPLEF